MTLTWPTALAGLLAVPFLVLGYRGLLRRRAARAQRLAGLGLVAPAAGAGRRRHVGPALFLGALVLLLVSFARPEATVAEPRREGTVVLAFDASSSMAATDLAPSRMEAAKAAARSFVERQPSSVLIGVVAFGEAGLVTQAPTQDRAEVLAAIDRMGTQGGTSLGRGLQTALTAIAGAPVQLVEAEDGSVEVQGPLGFYGSSAVVLLSDGENTDGPDPVQVAEVASTAGVKVYPVGLGSAEGTVLEVDGYQVSTQLDEEMLQAIAETTDGAYYSAPDEETLTEIYSSLDLAWTVRGEQVEVTGLFAAAAALLLLLGAGFTFLHFGRVV